MLASYHTHTKLCNHAVGEIEEYVLVAIERGVRTLGFADHAPMIYPAGYVSHYKMLPEEIVGYFTAITELKEKYSDRIDIKIGFETEYYPDLWDRALEFWKPYPLDYLILGQHFPRDEFYAEGAVYCANEIDDKNQLKLYTDTVIEGINTGKITYIAHPDLFNFVGDLDYYRQEMRRLISEAKRLSVPLEINLLGLTEGRSYPKEVFWREVGILGAKSVIGCDSHSPDRVAKPEEILAAKRYADKFGVELLEDVEIRSVY